MSFLAPAGSEFMACNHVLRSLTAGPVGGHVSDYCFWFNEPQMMLVLQSSGPLMITMNYKTGKNEFCL